MFADCDNHHLVMESSAVVNYFDSFKRLTLVLCCSIGNCTIVAVRELRHRREQAGTGDVPSQIVSFILNYHSCPRSRVRRSHAAYPW